MAINVAIFAYDNCLASGITGPIDILKIANTHKQMIEQDPQARVFNWKVVSADGRPIRTSSGLIINVDGRLQDNGIELLIVPGVDHVRAGEMQQVIAGLVTQVGESITQLYQAGCVVAAFCSGTFLLAELGLLNGLRATTSWWLAPLFADKYPKVLLNAQEIVTEDHNIYCAGAVTAYVHLSIHLIERFGGKDLASRCAKTVLIHGQCASQAPLLRINRRLKIPDDMVQEAITWMRDHITDELHLEALTERFAVSQRTFIRRFRNATGKPPHQYLQKLRIEEAKHLLESTSLSIERITEEVGYADVSSLRRLFKKEVEMSPTEYRKRYSNVALAATS